MKQNEITILIALPFIFSAIFLASRTFTCYLLKRNKESQAMKQLETLIAATKGKFFSITFTRNDGKVRVINGKDKYHRLLKGGRNMVKQAGYLTAVNRNKEDWFSFKPDSVITFKCGAIEKTFVV